MFPSLVIAHRGETVVRVARTARRASPRARTSCGGALLPVVEAMKRKQPVRAPHAGTVATLRVRGGDQVAASQPLVEVVA